MPVYEFQVLILDGKTFAQIDPARLRVVGDGLWRALYHHRTLVDQIGPVNQTKRFAH